MRSVFSLPIRFKPTQAVLLVFWRYAEIWNTWKLSGGMGTSIFEKTVAKKLVSVKERADAFVCLGIGDRVFSLEDPIRTLVKIRPNGNNLLFCFYSFLSETIWHFSCVSISFRGMKNYLWISLTKLLNHKDSIYGSNFW